MGVISRKIVILSLLLLLMFPVITSKQNNLVTSDQIERKPRSVLPASQKMIWHDDCSNVSGWSIEPNPPQVRLDGIQDDVDLLSNGSAIYSSSIPFALGRWHGSMFIYELETPVYVGHGLNFEVELNHPGSLNYMGGMEVGLYDQDQNISVWVSIVDSWYSSAFLTDLAYGDDGTNYVHTTSRSGSLLADYRVWNDEETDTIKGQDNLGNYTLANETEFDPEREIHYVGIMFWNVESNDYESNSVLDILIEGTPVGNDIAIWHDDCTNTSSFPDLADAWYTGAMGSIASVDGYIYATDYGSASGSHGPVYYHTFQPAIAISDFDWLEAEIELNGSSSMGAAAIMLYDSDYKRIAILDVADSWIADDEAASYAGWYDLDFNAVYTPKNHPADTLPEPYHETLRLEFNSTGLYGLIPRVGEFKMLDVGDLELEREISYLCVQFRQSNAYTPCQTMRIHDIQMQYTESSLPQEDIDPPIITSLLDFSFEYGSDISNFGWNVSDANPDYYWVMLEYLPMSFGPWNGSDIAVSLEGLDIGVYNFTLILRDAFDQFSMDSVIVTIEDTTSPTITHPFDMVIPSGYDNYSLTWHPDDLKPDNYNIYQNGSLVSSGLWNNEALIYNLTALEVGTYEYRIVVYDSSGNSADDTVLVFVVDEASTFVPLDYVFVISIGSVVVIVVIVGAICRSRGQGPSVPQGYDW